MENKQLFKIKNTPSCGIGHSETIYEVLDSKLIRKHIQYEYCAGIKSQEIPTTVIRENGFFVLENKEINEYLLHINNNIEIIPEISNCIDGGFYTQNFKIQSLQYKPKRFFSNIEEAVLFLMLYVLECEFISKKGILTDRIN
jgi:hypothetical protein